MVDKEFQVNGTLIWYYYICKRQVWLQAHSLGPDQDDENISKGRNIHEFSYPRDKKELDLGHIKIDLLRSEKGNLILGEIKKSSRFLTSATRQLQFYLLQRTYGPHYPAENCSFEKQRLKVILVEASRRTPVNRTRDYRHSSPRCSSISSKDKLVKHVPMLVLLGLR